MLIVLKALISCSINAMTFNPGNFKKKVYMPGPTLRGSDFVYWGILMGSLRLRTTALMDHNLRVEKHCQAGYKEETIIQ